jgi:hypothetical protein
MKTGRARAEWVERLARLGFTARGLVYILVGFLAAKYAAGLGGGVTDTEGAMRTVSRGPFGAVILSAIAVGLAAYACWRFAQAFFDLDGKGRDLKGRAIRAGFVGSGLVHLGLAFTAATLAVGVGRRSDGDEVRLWTARAFDAPLGSWMVLAAGFVMLGAGAWQVYKAWSDKFEEHLKVGSMGADERKWTRWVGRAGLLSRAVTFGLIGWFLVRASLESNPGQARGFAGVLRSLRTYERGDLLLFAVGAGLVAYGVLSLVNARYRRIAR